MSVARAWALLLLGTALTAADGADVPVPAVAAAAARGRLAQGEKAEAAARYTEALDHYRAGLAAAPEDPVAAAAVERLERLLGQRPLPAGDLGAGDGVQRELAEVEISLVLARAERLALAGDHHGAAEAARTAEDLLRRHPDGPAGQRLGQVRELIAGLDQRRHDDQIREGSVGRQRSQDAARKSAEAERIREAGVFQTRLDRILDLEAKGFYELALDHCRRTVRDYPDEREADALFQRLLNRVHRQRKLDLDEQMAELRLEVSERFGRSLIPSPIDQAPSFPAGFDQLHRQREGWDATAEIPAWQQALLDRLTARISLSCDGADLVEVLEQIARQTGINLVIGSEVRAAGSAPVTLHARAMRVDAVLAWLARQTGVRWSLRNEAVFIGKDDTEVPELRVYDITEVAYRPPDFPGMDVSAAIHGFTQGGGGRGQAGGLDFTNLANNQEVAGKGIAPEDLVDLMKRAVSPGAWANPAYGIQIRHNMLLVTAPPRLQVLVNQFLRSVRGAHNQMVAVDCRWLEVSDAYMEEIGLNWNNVGGVLSRAPVADGFSQEFNPESSVAASTAHFLPETAVNLAGAMVGEGLNLQWVHLGKTQLSAIFTAIEKNRKGRQLDAMNLTTLNGVRANVFYGTQIAYVSDYTIGGDGNWDSEFELVSVGQSLDLKPMISSDRKYVRLDLRPLLVTAEIRREMLTVVRTVNDVTFNSMYPLEMPIVHLTSAATSVMVPDRGSILVGGFGTYKDQSSKAQVPFLGHVPFLGRLFSKRGRYSERSQLYLSLTARIILNDEEEAFQ